MLDATPPPDSAAAAAMAPIAATADADAAENPPALVHSRPADDEDLRLLAAYRLNDPRALEQLYHRHAERVWRYARYFSGQDDAAAEILQDTFLRVIKYLPTFEGRSRFSTWLFTLARSAAVQHIRNRQRTLALQENRAMPANSNPNPNRTTATTTQMDQLPARAADPADQAQLAETRAQVRAAVARLPENEREALVLFEVDGMTMADAGELLGWSAAKMKVTVFRARRRLRDFLMPTLHPPETS